MGIESRRTGCIARANTSGLYTAGMSHLLIYVWSTRVMIVSIYDSELMWPGYINSTPIVLTDAMTQSLVIIAYQC